MKILWPVNSIDFPARARWWTVTCFAAANAVVATTVNYHLVKHSRVSIRVSGIDTAPSDDHHRILHHKVRRVGKRISIQTEQIIRYRNSQGLLWISICLWIHSLWLCSRLWINSQTTGYRCYCSLLLQSISIQIYRPTGGGGTIVQWAPCCPCSLT